MAPTLPSNRRGLKQNQSKREITFDTRLKTALSAEKDVIHNTNAVLQNNAIFFITLCRLQEKRMNLYNKPNDRQLPVFTVTPSK